MIDDEHKESGFAVNKELNGFYNVKKTNKRNEKRVGV